MKQFTYVDYNNKRSVIFTCEANGILEADQKLLEATGIIASKRNDIGCESKEIVLNDGPKIQ